MKTKVLLSLITIFNFCLLSAQVPQGFNYQAIARDGSGSPIINTELPVIITIQSDSLGGTIFWEELHSTITTNGYGLFTLIVGKGVKQASSTISSFNEINWTVTPKFIKVQILYKSNLINMGSSRMWSVPYSMAAGDLTGPISKLEVVGKTDVMDEALFEVKNKNGQTVFAVYNEGVRIYVDDGNAKGRKGGFAIGSFGTAKSNSQPLLVVDTDSIRAYIDSNTNKALKGGFAIGGFDKAKGPVQNYLVVNPDSIRAYIDNDANKARKGGFAIGGFSKAKGLSNEYMLIDPDSTNFYVRSKPLSNSSTFNIVGIDMNQGQKSLLNANTDTIKIAGVLNVQNNLLVFGDINVGGTMNIISDIDGNSYKTVKIGTQVWMAENLKTTKYNDGTAIPNVTDNTAWAALTTGAYSDYSNTPANSTTYGRLYNWYTVDNNVATKVASNGGKNVCPTGWHVPSDAEWTTLTDYLGGESVAGGKLKEIGTTYWGTPNTGATNETGFTALAGGFRYLNGTYTNFGNFGYWWSSSVYSGNWAYYRVMSYFDTGVQTYYDTGLFGLSVRCIKDN